MEEIWKDVVGYEGYYEVSSLGNVRSVSRMVRSRGRGMRLSPAKIRKQALSTKGYHQVGLSMNGVITTLSVHRLVAECFVLNTDSNKDQVNHIDGDKTNNIFHNLEWVNNSENAIHAFRLGLRIPNNIGKFRMTSGATREELYDKIVKLVAEGFNQREIGDILGVHRVTVGRYLTKFRKLKDNTLVPL